jgi:UV DNA damage endonuclease
MTDIVRKVGFACKVSAFNAKGQAVSVPDLNTSSTTITYLNRVGTAVAERKLWETLETNIKRTCNMVRYVAKLEPSLRMVRISSDLLPAYTHEAWSYFYKQPDVIRRLEELFAQVGQVAREHGVRLSFHPGQFCVLASETDQVVDRSVAEFEYHVDMARMMGYGKQFQDFKINVHISGRRGPQGIIDVLPRLTPEARNMITIENDEMTWGLDASLELADHVALVLDLHHHFIKTGEYIEATDSRIQRIIDSWRGVRPVIHYSVSREEYVANHDTVTRPCLTTLLESGYKKQFLRAHSDRYWNHAVNEWAATHSAWADIMCESKWKNLASIPFYEKYIKEKTNV